MLIGKISKIIAIIVLFYLILLPAKDVQEDDLLSYMLRQVEPGGSVSVNTRLKSLQGDLDDKIEVQYTILDKTGKIINQYEPQTVPSGKDFFNSQVKIPEDLKPGEYEIGAFVLYKGERIPVLEKVTFEVPDKIFGLSKEVFLWYFMLLSICLILFLFLVKRVISGSSK